MNTFFVYIGDDTYVTVHADDFILDDDKVSFISSYHDKDNNVKKKIVAVFTVANIKGFKELEEEKDGR